MRYLIIAILLKAAYGQLLNGAESPVTDGIYEGSYIVMFQKCIHIGMPHDVLVHILKGVSPVNVTVELFKTATGILMASEQKDVQPGKPQIITLQASDELNFGSLNRKNNIYDIKVTGCSSGINFTKKTTVSLYEYPDARVLVQLDKEFYKPNQTVHYRIFNLKPDLKLDKRDLNITIKGPGTNIFLERKEAHDATGLIKGSFNLPDAANAVGFWSIDARAPGMGGSSKFEVKEYECISDLPMIEVTVTPPSFIVITQSRVVLAVTAKYIIGGDVRGTLLVTGKRRYKDQPKVQQEVDNFQGSATVTFSIDEILEMSGSQDYYNGLQISFEAKLTENGTGITTRGEGITRIYEAVEKVLYFPTNPSAFKPALSYTAYAMVTKQDGSPIDPEADKLKVLVQQSYYVNVSRPVGEENDNGGTLSKQFEAIRKTVNVTYMELDVPADGFVKINIPSVPR